MSGSSRRSGRAALPGREGSDQGPTAAVDLAARKAASGPVHADRPLTSVEAFVLALVEASSGLTVATPGISTDRDYEAFEAPHDDAVAGE